MNNLVVFILGGLMFRYGIDILDNIVSWIGLITSDFQNKQSLEATKIQKEINDISQEMQIQDDGNRIGFQMQSEELEYEEEDF